MRLKITSRQIALIMIFAGASLLMIELVPRIAANGGQSPDRELGYSSFVDAGEVSIRPLLISRIVDTSTENQVDRLLVDQADIGVDEKTQNISEAEVGSLPNREVHHAKLDRTVPENTVVEPPAEEVEINGRLIVSKIDLDQQIVPLPFTDGQWRTDDLGSDVGLLGGTGRFPQDEKAMVFAGHYTTYWPIGGPFLKLDHLMPNDEITYIYNDQEYLYRISQLAYVDPSQVNLILRDDGDQLLLLTCGQFNLLTASFEKRLLVVADLIDIQPVPINQLAEFED